MYELVCVLDEEVELYRSNDVDKLREKMRELMLDECSDYPQAEKMLNDYEFGTNDYDEWDEDYDESRTMISDNEGSVGTSFHFYIVSEESIKNLDSADLDTDSNYQNSPSDSDDDFDGAAFWTGMAVGAAMIGQKGAARNWDCDIELTSLTLHCLNEGYSEEQAYMYAKDCAEKDIVPDCNHDDGTWNASCIDWGCALGSVLGFPSGSVRQEALDVLHAFMENYDYGYIQEFYLEKWKPEHDG